MKEIYPMKKLLLLLFIIPFFSFAQDETPTIKRDKIIITNLIRQQLPELFSQSKYSEVIKLVTEDFIMTNYEDGKEEIIMGKEELKRFYKERNFGNLNPIYTIKNLRILDKKAFVSGDYIHKIDNVIMKPIVFIMTLTKQPDTSWLVSHEINVLY